MLALFPEAWRRLGTVGPVTLHDLPMLLWVGVSCDRGDSCVSRLTARGTKKIMKLRAAPK